MSPLAALTFMPAWSLSFAVGLLALRLGRARGLGLVLLCLSQTVWLTGLLLFVTPETASLGERVIPLGLLEAAGFVHATADLEGRGRRGLVLGAWAVAGGIGLLGALSPRLLFAPSLASPGPLFAPVLAAGAAGCLVLLAFVGRCARQSEGRARRRFLALGAGALLGTAGGGVTVALLVLGMGGVWLSAGPMLGSIALASFAVLDREEGRARRLVVTGLVYAVITSAVSALGLTAYALALPRLSPPSSSLAGLFGWGALVTFFATLPLDPLRQLLVEALGRKLVADPIGVRDLADAVERSEERADHAEGLAALGQVVSAVAHEIRNPLGVLLVQARLLEKAGAPEARVRAIREQVARAQQFVDSLLRYGKPRPLSFERVSLLPLVERAARQVPSSLSLPTGTTRSVAVEVAGDPAVEAEVDASAIGDVVVVLVGNAVAALADVSSGKHSEGGLVSVRVEAAGEAGRAGEAGEAGEAVRITVDDDGPGVAPEIASSLFEPFVTGRGRDAALPGTGLGLAIARRWVERHGGTLTHQPSPRGGARFVVSLPPRARLVPESPPERR